MKIKTTLTKARWASRACYRGIKISKRDLFVVNEHLQCLDPSSKHRVAFSVIPESCHVSSPSSKFLPSKIQWWLEFDNIQCIKRPLSFANKLKSFIEEWMRSEKRKALGKIPTFFSSIPYLNSRFSVIFIFTSRLESLQPFFPCIICSDSCQLAIKLIHVQSTQFHFCTIDTKVFSTSNSTSVTNLRNKNCMWIQNNIPNHPVVEDNC